MTLVTKVLAEKKKIFLYNLLKLKNEEDILNLYLIDGTTGRIIFNSYVTSVSFDHNINLLCDDNGVYLSYFSK